MNSKGLLILLAIAMIAASSSGAAAASAGAGTKVSGDTIVWAKPSAAGFSIVPMTVSSSIIQGQTNWHSKVVSSYITSMDVDLSWGNTASSLTLTIYSPSGSVYGVFFDGDDGSADGEIHAYVNNPDGVTQGTWNMKVYGYSVSGIQSYTI